LFSKFNDMLDAVEVYLLAGKAVVDIANAVLDLFAQFTVVGDEALDGVFAFVKGIIDETLAVVRAGDTTEWRSDLKCALYCRLLQYGGYFGDTKALIITPWKGDITGLSPIPIGLAFNSFLDSIDIGAFQQRARISANNVGEVDDCAACTYWDVWLDFTTGAHSWVSEPMDGSGWGASRNSTGWHRSATGFAISTTLPAGCHITTIELVSYSAGTWYSDLGAGATGNPYRAGYQYSSSSGTITPSGYTTTTNQKLAVETYGNDLGKIRLHGSGVKPTTGENC